MNNSTPLDTITEEWRDIYGFEGLYQVSNLGRVRSLDRWTHGGKRLRPGIVMTPTHHREYPALNLVRDGKITAVRIHVLVAEAFIGGRPDGRVINHINGVKTDNRVVNLEYVTHRENSRHASRMGLYGQCVKERNQRIVELRAGGMRIKDIAALVGESVGVVGHALRGKRIR